MRTESMRKGGYLCEREALNLCLTHYESPWLGSDPAKCHIHVVDRTDNSDPSYRWNRRHNKTFPAEFWFVCENGSESFLGYADWIDTDPDTCHCEQTYQPVLRCLSGDIYDALRDMRDHLATLDWSER